MRWATERDGCTDFRKHVAWYLKGFPVGGELRRGAGDGLVAGRAGRPARQARRRRAVPASTSLGQPRGRTNAPGKVALPDGWLADRDDDAVPEGAELRRLRRLTALHSRYRLVWKICR